MREYNERIAAQLSVLRTELYDASTDKTRAFTANYNQHFSTLNALLTGANNANAKVNIDEFNRRLDALKQFIQNYAYGLGGHQTEAYKVTSATKIDDLKERLLAMAREPAPGPAPAVAVDPPAPAPARVEARNLADQDIRKSVNAYINSKPAGQAVLEDLAAEAGHDVNFKVNYTIPNVSPIIFKRPTRGNLILTSENPTPETRAEQAAILKKLSPEGPKSLKISAGGEAEYKALWKAMRTEGHHITDMSDQEIAWVDQEPEFERAARPR
ncbi:MAG: hypothetical protein M3R00_03535 [Pseudomonadota bacterium]|nr:hypothetical protein [Pseudomonadota bacterium]